MYGQQFANNSELQARSKNSPLSPPPPSSASPSPTSSNSNSNSNMANTAPKIVATAAAAHGGSKTNNGNIPPVVIGTVVSKHASTPAIDTSGSERTKQSSMSNGNAAAKD